jgi:hypothetical protein
MRQKDLVLGTLGFSVNAVHAHLWSKKKNDVSFWEKKEKNKEIGKRDWERKKFKNKINKIIAYQKMLGS